MNTTTSRFRGWLAILWCAAALGCASDQKGEPAGDQTGVKAIVLITIDGLVSEDLSVFGGPIQTPNLKRIADAGIAWSDVWTVSPLTRPAVATYLTGLAPDRHGVADDLLSALPGDTPTLAGALAGQGFRTAAFPDTNVLGPSSGLLRDFELIDDPPGLAIGPITWLPHIKLPGELATDIEAYIGSLGDGDRFFAWIHFSGPVNSQTLLEIGSTPPLDTIPEGQGAPRPEDAMERVDRAVGRILDGLDAKGVLKRSAVIVAATGGDARGGDGELPGVGFSLHERAVRVPVIARFPGGRKGPAQSRLAWSPDVAVTIATVAGTRLVDSEGVELFADAPADRVIFAWSGAPRDQLGWRALRAVRSGDAKRIEGLEDRTVYLGADPGTVDPDTEQRLVRALTERSAEPFPPSLPAQSMDELLANLGVDVDRVPAEGRRFGSHESRQEVLGRLWSARQAIHRRKGPDARELYRQVIERDPKNLAGLLGLGQILALTGSPDAKKLMGRALKRYPYHPEVAHWYGHAIWSEAWEDAEPLILAVQPHMPNQADVLYDLACSRSLAKDLEASEEYLRAAIEAGYAQWVHMETDADLRNLRESRRLAAVMREHGR